MPAPFNLEKQMSDKYIKVINILKDIEALDEESQLVIWTSLSEELSIRSPSKFFTVFSNAIKLSFVSSQDEFNFATVASAVFLSLKDKLQDGSLATNALARFSSVFPKKDGGYDN